MVVDHLLRRGADPGLRYTKEELESMA